MLMNLSWYCRENRFNLFCRQQGSCFDCFVIASALHGECQLVRFYHLMLEMSHHQAGCYW